MTTVQKVPATVITGFLGAGKTTLIRHLLGNAKGRRIALIVNEFGDAGVDGEILKSCGADVCREEDIIELANGCICCTVADDFVPTMTTLLNRADPFDHIVIETSGLALPQPLVRAFNWPEIKSKVTIDGVVTVVDAKALSEGRFVSDEAAVQAQREADPNVDHENPIEELFEDQLNCADLVLLNKTDLLERDQTPALARRLGSKIRPGAQLVPVSHGMIDITVLLGLGSSAEDDLGSRLSHHEMEGEIQHDHDDFTSFIVSLDEHADKAALLSRIDLTVRNHDILRLKGFASIKDSPGRLLIQAVGPRVNHYFDRAWRNDEIRRTQFVIIGEKGMNQAAIAATLKG